MADQPTLEQLSDWLSSPTTEWYFAYVQREWGPSGMRYQQAVRDASQSANAVVELQKVLHTQEQLIALIKHPANVLSQMRSRKQTIMAQHGASRRGPGL